MGSRAQVCGARVAAPLRPSSSPRKPMPGVASASRSRMVRSTARSTSVTGSRSPLGVTAAGRRVRISSAATAMILHLQRTLGPPTAVGLLLFAQAIPPIAAPFAGTIADRLRPARLLGAGLLTQAALAGILALRLPSLGPLLAIVFLLALADTPLGAAVGRCIPVVVADEDLVAANALRGGMRELGTVLGAPLAGLIFATSGARLGLGL